MTGHDKPESSVTIGRNDRSRSTGIPSNKLLAEEMALRRQTESVAALRRALPAGGMVAEDFLFEGDDGPLKLSDLFKPGMDTLAIYSFMFGPDVKLPCTGCTHFLDGLEGMVRHITQRINLAVVAKSPLPRLLALARTGAPSRRCCRAVSSRVWTCVHSSPAAAARLAYLVTTP